MALIRMKVYRYGLLQGPLDQEALILLTHRPHDDDAPWPPRLPPRFPSSTHHRLGGTGGEDVGAEDGGGAGAEDGAGAAAVVEDDAVVEAVEEAVEVVEVAEVEVVEEVEEPLLPPERVM